MILILSGEGRRVRCVLFDLDGTLYDSKGYNEYFDSEMTRIVADFLKVEEGEASRILKSRRKEEGTLTRAIESLGLSRQEFHQLVSKRVDPGPYLSSNDSARDVITRLRSRNLRVGLVSNSGRILVDKILKALGLDPGLFDVVVSGTDVEPKPSHQPFVMALAKIGCARVEGVYVGDRDEAEIRPAHEVGLRTVLLARSKTKSDVKWADRVINDLSELEEAIDSLQPPAG